MLSKCANPSCAAQFRYFHQGKLFRIEVPMGESSQAQESPAKPERRMEFFWLCDGCASQMTLSCDSKGSVLVKPVSDLRAAS